MCIVSVSAMVLAVALSCVAVSYLFTRTVFNVYVLPHSRSEMVVTAPALIFNEIAGLASVCACVYLFNSHSFYSFRVSVHFVQSICKVPCNFK